MENEDFYDAESIEDFINPPNNKLKRQTEELHAGINGITKDLKRSIEEFHREKSNIEEVKLQNRNLKSTVEVLNATLDESEVKIEELSQKLNELHSELEEKQENEKKLLEEKQREAKLVAQKDEDFMKQIEDERRHNEGLLKQIIELKSNEEINFKKQEELEENEKKLLEEKLKEAKLVAQKDEDLMKQIEEERRHNEDLLKQIIELKNNEEINLQKQKELLLQNEQENNFNEDLKNEVLNLQKTCADCKEDLKKQIEMERKNNAELRRQIEDLARNQTVCIEDVNKLIEEDLKSEKQIKPECNKNTQKDDEYNEDLIRQIEEQKNNADLKQQIEEDKKNNADLQLQIEEEKKKNTDLMQQIDEEKKKNADLKQKIDEEKKNADLKQKIEEKKSNADLTQQIDEEMNNVNLKQQIGEEQKSNAEFKQQIEDEKKSNADLKQQIEELKFRRNTEKNLMRKIEKLAVEKRNIKLENKELKSKIKILSEAQSKLIAEFYQINEEPMCSSQDDLKLIIKKDEVNSIRFTEEWYGLIKQHPQNYKSLKEKFNALLDENSKLKKSVGAIIGREVSCITALQLHINDQQRHIYGLKELLGNLHERNNLNSSLCIESLNATLKDNNRIVLGLTAKTNHLNQSRKYLENGLMCFQDNNQIELYKTNICDITENSEQFESFIAKYEIKNFKYSMEDKLENTLLEMQNAMYEQSQQINSLTSRLQETEESIALCKAQLEQALQKSTENKYERQLVDLIEIVVDHDTEIKKLKLSEGKQLPDVNFKQKNDICDLLTVKLIQLLEERENLQKQLPNGNPMREELKSTENETQNNPDSLRKLWQFYFRHWLKDNNLQKGHQLPVFNLI